MINKFKKWWASDERLDQLEKTLRDLVEAKSEIELAKQAIEDKAAEQEQELQRLKAEKDADERRKNGPDPYVEIKSADFSVERGIQIELDWNEAFISLLRENGIKGKTDEIIVQKWLAILYDDVIQRIQEDTTEDSISTENKNEFE